MRSPLRCFIFAGVLLAAGWLLFFTAKEPLSRMIAKAAGGTLLRISDGKFNDPQLFVAGRLHDVLWLATIALLLALATRAADAGARRFTLYNKARGVWLGTILFAAVNIWWATAAHTVTFWCLFYQPNSGFADNYTQFHIKKYLSPELNAGKRVLLVGNSQVCSNLDERVINRVLAPGIWTTEMHQSGACGFDTMLLLRDLRETEGDLIIDYVSPIRFYGSTNGKVVSQYLRWRDLPDLVKWGGTDKLPSNAIKLGLAGKLFPLVSGQSCISQRLIGGAIVFLPQQIFDSSLETDLAAQASLRRDGLHLGPVSDFEKRAFAQGIAEAVARGRRVLLIMGGYYPVSEKLTDPRIRPDFEAFLNSLQRKHPGSVFVLPESDLIQVDESDYMDLVHWKKETQAKFSEVLAGRIPRYLESPAANLGARDSTP